MFKLVIQDDEGKTTVVPLIRDEITIGRKEGNTIRLTERNVSRRHARILRNNGEVQIEDLGSYNGIRVNNARIAERVSLRVSDQVQIGDYKLYLKAEGVEQVDDARTMPIERIDAIAEMPTGGMAAGTQPPAAIPATPSPNGAAGAATVPIPVVASSTTGSTPAAPQLVGTPGRTMVALSDADTVRAAVGLATAQAVAALNAPVGYGRLVVLSSNFAGKEFELSRPQMIIGRTDENDIVINHRSISRNHAKVVREPETGRYTVSDLQSSNGVRVNGQDYGKVELRRGDVVDLGHVRLRFVEPGEDFVFARDAVITDVPEAGGKRSLLVAVLLGVVVLGGIGVYVMTRGDKAPSGTDRDHVVTPNTGSGSAQIPNITPVNPGSDINGTGSGSDLGSGSAMIAITSVDGGAGGTTTTITDPGSGSGVASADDRARKRAECKQLQQDRKWQDLLNCAGDLSHLGDDAMAAKIHDAATVEQKNELLDGKLASAITAKEWADAKKQLDKMSDDSVYKPDDKARLDTALKAVIDDFRNKAKALARDHKCKDVDVTAKQALAVSVEAADAVRAIHCEAPAATPPVDHQPDKTPDHVTVVTPPANCDAGALAQKGKDEINVGQYAAAVASLESSLRCQQDPALYRLILLAACNSANAAKAKQYFAKLPTSQQSQASQMCIRNKIPLP